MAESAAPSKKQKQRAAAALPAAIDVWCQPAVRSFLEGLPEGHPLMRKSGSAALLDAIKQPDIAAEGGLSPDDHVRLMDAANVKQAAICAWYRPGRTLISNEQIKQFKDRHPTRFLSIASVDLSDPVAAVEQLDRAVFEYGAVGLRIVPWLWNLPPNDKLYYPLLTRCVQLDIPFCTQVGHTGPMCPSEPGRPIPYVDEIALRFPRLKIIGGHIGAPWTQEMIGLAWKYDNVFIDTSAYLPRYYPPELLHFINTTGKEKVMFGTNFPQISWKRAMDQIPQLNLRDDSLRLFLAGNAERVFALDQPKKKPVTISTSPVSAILGQSLSQPLLPVTEPQRMLDSRRADRSTESRPSVSLGLISHL